MMRTSDPMERLIEAALTDAGIAFATDHGGQTAHGLDFHLPLEGVAIEVKRFHSDRACQQLARAENVILAQGEVAVRFLADLLRSASTEHTPQSTPAHSQALTAAQGSTPPE